MDCYATHPGGPKVSVLMVTYNHEKYIAQAIESVLMQDVHFDYEIVIGEDCSTDGTREVVVDLASRCPDRFRLMLRERNLGIRQNYVLSSGACRGEYIAVLEGDDYWTSPHKLQRQVDFLDTHPECAYCVHNVKVLSEDATREHFDLNPAGRKVISTLEDLLGGCFFNGSSMMFRRMHRPEILDWAQTHSSVDDWAFGVWLAQHGKIGYIDEVMGVFRLHSGGMWTGRSRMQQLEAIISSYGKMNAQLDYQYNETIKSYSLGCYYELAIEHEKRGDLDRAATHLRRCVSERSSVLEERLSALGLCGPGGRRIIRRRLWLYDHPMWYRLLRSAQPLAKRMRRLWITARDLGRSVLRRPVGSIAAHPNPIRASREQWEGGVTTLCWTSARTESVEVHLGAPDGPLFSRSGPSGSEITGAWMRDGMIFYLQDVSGGLPLTFTNTLAAVRVRVTTGEQSEPLGPTPWGFLGA